MVSKKSQLIRIALVRESKPTTDHMVRKKRQESVKTLREKEIFFIEEPGKHKDLELTHSHERITAQQILFKFINNRLFH
jgi:hypothetical protein